MLLFKRKRGEGFVIQPKQSDEQLNNQGHCTEPYFSKPIRVQILGVRNGIVSVGIEADNELLVLREELLPARKAKDVLEID